MNTNLYAATDCTALWTARETRTIQVAAKAMRRTDALATLRGMMQTVRTTGDLKTLGAARIIANTIR